MKRCMYVLVYDFIFVDRTYPAGYAIRLLLESNAKEALLKAVKPRIFSSCKGDSVRLCLQKNKVHCINSLLD